MKEIISYIPYFISVLLSVVLYNLCYEKLNNCKLKINKKKAIIIFLVALSAFFNNAYNNLWIKFLATFIVIVIDFYMIFTKDWKKSIISYIIICLILIFIEIILSDLLNILGILTSYTSVINYSIIKIYLSTIIGIIEYILISIKFINNTLKRLIDFLCRNFNFLNFVFLLPITYLIIGIINIENFATKGSMRLIFLLSIIFILLFTIIIRLMSHEEILKVTNKKLIDYNENYGKFLDDYKIYKHNINHKLSAMKSFGNKKINALIDDLLDEETTFSIKNNELYNIPNGIKGIVAEKLYNKDYHVMIDNKIKKDPFSNLDARAFNSISEAIGIALDNAVEASEETEEPIILMDLYEDKENIYLKIGNNYCNSIDLDNIGSKYYSTKNRGSGLGLFSIIQNNLVKEKIEIINNFYYIELQIKKAR